MPRTGTAAGDYSLREEQMPFGFDEARDGLLLSFHESCVSAFCGGLHIRPVDANGPDIVSNGLAVSGTAHWMFDRELIGLDDPADPRVATGK